MNSNVINLRTARHARLQERAKGVTLCGSGFHKWKIDTGAGFDVKQGKLITTQRCTRCNETRTKLK
jgi:hypothetical protein